MTRLDNIEFLKNLARRITKAEDKLTDGGEAGLSYAIDVREGFTPVEVTISLETGSPSTSYAPIAGETGLPQCFHLVG